MMKQETDCAWSIGAVRSRRPLESVCRSKTGIRLREPPSRSPAARRSGRSCSRRTRSPSSPRPRACRRFAPGTRAGSSSSRPRAGRTPISSSSPERSGARKSISARARIMSVTRASKRSEVGDPRLLDVRQEDGVVHVPHLVDVPKADLFAVHEVEPLHRRDATGRPRPRGAPPRARGRGRRPRSSRRARVSLRRSPRAAGA